MQLLIKYNHTIISGFITFCCYIANAKIKSVQQIQSRPAELITIKAIFVGAETNYADGCKLCTPS